MDLGTFSVSLAVTDLAASRTFYRALGFESVGGDGTRVEILRNGSATIGLFQGLFDRNRLPSLGVPDDAFQIDGVEFYGKMSFLKAGIVYASHVTTVSETYAREITTPEFGCGLDGLLRRCEAEGRLTGILNGIDESWDPRTDTHLGSPFGEKNLKGKQANADEVRREFGDRFNGA